MEIHPHVCSPPHIQSVSMDDPPRTKERSNSSPSTTPKAAQFLLELSVPPRVPLPAEFTSQHGSLSSDAFPAHTPTPSQRWLWCMGGVSVSGTVHFYGFRKPMIHQ